DKEAFLKTREDALLESDANIAHQIWLQQQRLQQVNAQHRRRLFKLAKLNGFAGTLVPGTCVELSMTMLTNMDVDPLMATTDSDSEDGDSAHKVEDSKEDKALAEIVYNVRILCSLDEEIYRDNLSDQTQCG
ncbi:hypothetical protein C0991_010176, partial [Blastosporella zonata]